MCMSYVYLGEYLSVWCVCVGDVYVCMICVYSSNISKWDLDAIFLLVNATL